MISVANLKFYPEMNCSRVWTRNQILVWSRNWSGTEWKTNSRYGTNKQKKNHAKVYIKQFLLAFTSCLCFSSFCLQEVTMMQNKYLTLDFCLRSCCCCWHHQLKPATTTWSNITKVVQHCQINLRTQNEQSAGSCCGTTRQQIWWESETGLTTFVPFITL